ncbi:hypothetical protein [Candidatus Methylobacter oryzae]|uniref:hypothetical protein n=1 Tax=Candidatus Methylobacter oryzae TaxID=2497749 RepID=UPI0012B529B9|nr:hypothetical protein [Candidatus Methylobacter oryzae]
MFDLHGFGQVQQILFLFRATATPPPYKVDRALMRLNKRFISKLNGGAARSN